METEDDYFRVKRKYKKDLENKVFEELEKDAKKTKRKKKEVGMIMICSYRFNVYKKLSMNFSVEGETEAEYYRNLAEEAALKQNKKKENKKKVNKKKEKKEKKKKEKKMKKKREEKRKQKAKRGHKRFEHVKI